MSIDFCAPRFIAIGAALFFILSKVLALIFQPVNFIAMVLLVGVCLGVTRWARAGRRLVGAAVVVFVICCFSPLSAMLLRVLEDRFPHPAAAMPAPTGIVVLGGATEQEISLARDDISLNRAAPRLTAAVALSRLYPSARLVFTGGSADLRQRSIDEAQIVKKLWLSLGVPEARMTFESKSKNTFENAVFSREIVTPKPGETWLLVTSAWHMPRSVGIFRQAGFPVTAYPVDYRTYGTDRDWDLAFNAVESLERLDTAFHEWVGLGAYWLTGKTDALFPGP